MCAMCALGAGLFAGPAAAQDERLGPAHRVFLPHTTRAVGVQNALANGDFEAGAIGWGDACACITAAGPPGGWRSGDAGARLGRSIGQELRRTVTLPGDASSVRFGFWYQYHSQARDVYHLSDAFSVTVRDLRTGEVALWRHVAARSGLTAAWTHVGVDLSAWRGRTIAILFSAMSPSGETWAFVDDVALEATVARSAPLAARDAAAAELRSASR